MALSLTACFVALNLAKPTRAGQARNALFSVIINGLIWTPETFNPLLVRNN